MYTEERLHKQNTEVVNFLHRLVDFGRKEVGKSVEYAGLSAKQKRKVYILPVVHHMSRHPFSIRFCRALEWRITRL